MGSGASAENARSIEFNTRLKSLLPEFYVENVVLSAPDVDDAKKAWQLILNGEETEPFLEKKQVEGFEHASSLNWFYAAFYDRFFELCPDAKPLFANIDILVQGSIIAKIFSMALESVDNPDKVKTELEIITGKHNKRNIKPIQYGAMGNALIWTLELVIGKDFNFQTKLAWTRIYSHMLDIMLPIAVNYELDKIYGESSHPSQPPTPSAPKPWVVNAINIYFHKKKKDDKNQVYRKPSSKFVKFPSVQLSEGLASPTSPMFRRGIQNLNAPIDEEEQEK